MISDHLISPPADNEDYTHAQAHCTSFTGPKGVLADFKSQLSLDTHQRQLSESTAIEYNYNPRFNLPASRVKELNFNTFVAAIEDAPALETVIIHVYEPDLTVSHQTNDLLEKLAMKTSCSLYKIQATELCSVMFFDPVALPALLVYVNQVQTHCLLRITDEISEWTENASQELNYAFEKYLEDEGVLL